MNIHPLPKQKTLHGIPHNCAKSFFGTMRYYNKGYMADWLLNAARRLDLKNASLNLLTGTFTPNELNIRPLVINAKELIHIVQKETSSNGFDIDFIKEAVIDFEFPSLQSYPRAIYCFPYIVDANGKRYNAKRIIEEATELEFDAFDMQNIHPQTDRQISILEKFRNFFR